MELRSGWAKSLIIAKMQWSSRPAGIRRFGGAKLGRNLMSRHTHLSRRNLLAGAAGTLAFATADRIAAQVGKPNIVFILADDLGFADVSCYGQRDYTTPNVDRLALEGVRVTQASANSAVCSATRTALITGRYQYRLTVGREEPIAAATPKNIGLPPSH